MSLMLRSQSFRAFYPALPSLMCFMISSPISHGFYFLFFMFCCFILYYVLWSMCFFFSPSFFFFLKKQNTGGDVKGRRYGLRKFRAKLQQCHTHIYVSYLSVRCLMMDKIFHLFSFSMDVNVEVCIACIECTPFFHSFSLPKIQSYNTLSGHKKYKRYKSKTSNPTLYGNLIREVCRTCWFSSFSS